MLLVHQLLSGRPPPHLMSCDFTAREAATFLREKRIGGAPVVRDGQLIGFCSERDLVFRVLAQGLDPFGQLGLRESLGITDQLLCYLIHRSVAPWISALPQNQARVLLDSILLQGTKADHRLDFAQGNGAQKPGFQSRVVAHFCQAHLHQPLCIQPFRRNDKVN
jgi:CBS domain-containing protein